VFVAERPDLLSGDSLMCGKNPKGRKNGLSNLASRNAAQWFRNEDADVINHSV